VVLLHGLLGSPAYLLPLARVLARSRRVLVPELPGHRGSDPLVPFTMAGAADRLAAAARAVGVGEPALLGHSLGAPLAVHWAARHPVRGLVAASPVGLLPLHLGVLRHARPAGPAIARLAGAGARVLPRTTAGRWFVFGWFVGAARPQAIDPALGAELLRGAARSEAAVWEVLPELEQLDLRPAALRVACPALVVWGEHDAHRGNGPMLAEALRGDTAVLPGVGHMPTFESPYAFAVTARPWL
jgi:pimeloyl-ACP methyl ester carboxylesterase